MGKLQINGAAGLTGLLSAHGGISLNSSTAQETPEYILGIKAFADGGNIIWQSASNISVGFASSVPWSGITGKPSTFTPSSHTHSYIEAKGNYTFTSSTLPNSFDLGVSAGFVDSNSGFGSYGSVLTVRTYNGGGGSLQLYAPYSSSYGGTRLKARFGNYASSSGNSWTDLKELAWLSDLTWSNISGKPSTFTPSSHTHSYQPLESTTFSISNTTYVSVRTPNRTAAMYYEFWDSVGWASIRAGDIYDNNNRVLSAGNYTSYTVTKTGSGASGTWGISITGSAGSVAWGNITGKPSSFTPSSHSHSYIEYMDTRANNQSPNDLQAGLTIHLKTNGTDGLSDGASYHAVVGIKDWGDYSGGPYGQFAITANNAWFRNSSSGTAWNNWRKILDSSNYSSYALPLSGGTMSGTIITPGNDSSVIRPSKSNYDQIGASDYLFWKMFATYGYFNYVVTANYGTSAPTSTSLPVGTIYYKI